MLAYLKSLLPAKVAHADSAYTTIIYPAIGTAVVMHDGLGVAQECSLYPLPVVEREPDYHHLEPAWFVDDDPADELTGFADSAAENVDAYPGIPNPGPKATGDDLFDTGNSLSNFSCLAFTPPIEIIDTDFNPATGLPMLGGCLDSGGNPLGMCRDMF